MKSKKGGRRGGKLIVKSKVKQMTENEGKGSEERRGERRTKEGREK